jgi:hypothetical protein
VDYWEDCITEAMEDAGITATKEQIDTVICWVEGAHENYGMATGEEHIPNPLLAEIKDLKEGHAKEVSDFEAAEYNYRKSVATRRGVPVSSVYMDRDGSVMFDR